MIASISCVLGVSQCINKKAKQANEHAEILVVCLSTSPDQKFQIKSSLKSL